MKILVTAGPTREPLDPVRFISNRSSGKMGYAVASAAAARGHGVTLISGPVALQPPAGVVVIRVVTAEEMRRAVRRKLRWCDALVMAAAVADWRPARAAARKIKKQSRMALALRLVPTVDILCDVRPLKGRRLVVGFAAETGAPAERARRKLKEKGLDLIVANDVSRPDAGFDTDTNRVILLTPDGVRADWPLMSKAEAAGRLVRWLEKRLLERADISASTVRTRRVREKKVHDKH
jgi:phosphopantothenoylcysteine decarboxylase/phosphopantothenate--cysteine ligase